MSVLKTLTENIVKRDLQHEGVALQQKWEKTGLLEGLDDDYQKNTMSVLLENQAKELLREASTMQSGAVDGYAAVAFPIVRRVFGGLLANELVSVQPMSLPSGLIFFLDFTKGTTRDGDIAADGTATNPSIYGGGKTGAGVMTGVDVDGNEEGFYNLRQGLTAARGGQTPAANMVALKVNDIVLDGTTVVSETNQQLLMFDPDLCSNTHPAATNALVIDIDVSEDTAHGAYGGTIAAGSVTDGASATSDMQRIMIHGLSHLDMTDDANDDDDALENHSSFGTGARVVRRLTRFVNATGDTVIGKDFADLLATNGGAGNNGLFLRVTVVQASAAPAGFRGATDTVDGAAGFGPVRLNYAISDNLQSVSTALGALEGAAQWQFEDNDATAPGGIPEINIQVDSAAVTAATRKLKARWTPELAQDLNAYHNLDAEVELTGVLSEHIALEIDQEILGDLVRGATADTLFWSRNPGQFVNQTTGEALTAGVGDFTGTVSEWYETLVETVNDVSAAIHRKTLRGGANFLVCGPEVANVLEFTSGFRASVTHDDDKGTVGAINSGSISKKWDLWVDPYFPRNLILIGRKGGSFLESGYVYAPYVPLQVTPTIFDPDDFTPRKAVMTRYGKKMVNSDMYGLVIVTNLRGS